MILTTFVLKRYVKQYRTFISCPVVTLSLENPRSKEIAASPFYYFNFA
jgi:hypothetical protein